MAYDDDRWRHGDDRYGESRHTRDRHDRDRYGDYSRSGHDRGDYGRGDVDREMLETSRRLEQRHDYSPDLIADLRYFAGVDDEPRRDARSRSWTETRRDTGRGDTGRDEMASWVGDDDAERRRRMDAERGDTGPRHHRGRGPRGYTRSDERIREDVSDRLTDDPYVDASDIEVTVAACEVTLSGMVDHRMAKRRAEDIAESVSGVVYVQNNLRVRQPGPTTATGASAMAGMNTGMNTSHPGMRRY